MATFTQEEIEFIKERGNEHCKRRWLGLVNANNQPTIDTKDEQKMKDLMTLKYELKRYYLDPSMASQNNSPQTVSRQFVDKLSLLPNSLTKKSNNNSTLDANASQNANTLQNSPQRKELHGGRPNQSIPRVPNVGTLPVLCSPNGKKKNSEPVDAFTTDFADFSRVHDSFASVATSRFNQPIEPQPSFANFDNNPAFDSTKSELKIHYFSR